MPVSPEVAEKLRDMRARLQEAERLAGLRPSSGPPAAEPASQPPAKPPGNAIALLTSDAQRANQLYHWLIDGATDYDVAEAMRQAWPDADHQALAAAVIAKIRDAAQADPETVQGWCLEATRSLYRRMVEIGDFPGALRAVKQLRDLTA